MWLGAALAVLAMFLWRAIELTRLGKVIPYWADPWCCDIFNGNVLINFGLGPPTLPDVWTEGYAYPFSIGLAPRLLVMFVSAVLGALLVVRVARSLVEAARAKEIDAGRILILLCAVRIFTASALLIGSGVYFDRYGLDALWPLVLLLPLIVAWTRAKMVVAAVSASILLLFSALATQEYLRWNRLRWEGARALLASGVTIEQIDGGTEVTMMHRAAVDKPRLKRYLERGRYLITFHALPGHRVVQRRPFSSFLGLRKGEVFVLERVSE